LLVLPAFFIGTTSRILSTGSMDLVGHTGGRGKATNSLERGRCSLVEGA
jgi:hypothetical protein